MTATIAQAFSTGLEVAWTSTIPGLNIEITTAAVIVNVAAYGLDLLIWGDDRLTYAIADAPLNPSLIDVTRLSFTGRRVDDDALRRLVNGIIA